jgi:hypothetical protein
LITLTGWSSRNASAFSVTLPVRLAEASAWPTAAVGTDRFEEKAERKQRRNFESGRLHVASFQELNLRASDAPAINHLRSGDGDAVRVTCV